MSYILGIYSDARIRSNFAGGPSSLPVVDGTPLADAPNAIAPDAVTAARQARQQGIAPLPPSRPPGVALPTEGPMPPARPSILSNQDLSSRLGISPIDGFTASGLTNGMNVGQYQGDLLGFTVGGTDFTGNKQSLHFSGQPWGGYPGADTGFSGDSPAGSTGDNPFGLLGPNPFGGQDQGISGNIGAILWHIWRGRRQIISTPEV